MLRSPSALPRGVSCHATQVRSPLIRSTTPKLSSVASVEREGWFIKAYVQLKPTAVSIADR